MISLSVIIVSYNNLEVIRNCLDSIRQYNDIGNHLEVIVIEQSPNEDIYNFVKQTYPWVTVKREENKGFGAGNNRGAELANGDYLLFLNPDTALVEPVFKYAVTVFAKNPSLGLFGVQLLDAQGIENSSYECIEAYGIKAKLTSKLAKKTGRYNERKMYIQGADLFVRRDAFEKAGRFDENIFMYGEEPDLCLRIMKAGYHTAFFKKKKIIHLEGATNPQEYHMQLDKQLHSYRYVCEKHGMNFEKIVKSERRYQQMKAALFKLAGPRFRERYESAVKSADVITHQLEQEEG